MRKIKNIPKYKKAIKEIYDEQARVRKVQQTLTERRDKNEDTNFMYRSRLEGYQDALLLAERIIMELIAEEEECSG